MCTESVANEKLVPNDCQSKSEFVIGHMLVIYAVTASATVRGSRLRRSSRRRSSRLTAIWIVTEATERYQMYSILKPGIRDQMNAGFAKSSSRNDDANSGGRVLPS